MVKINKAEPGRGTKNVFGIAEKMGTHSNKMASERYSFEEATTDTWMSQPKTFTFYFSRKYTVTNT